MIDKNKWLIVCLLILPLPLSSCKLLQTEQTQEMKRAKGLLAKQRKEKLLFLEASREFILSEGGFRKYSVDFENRTMSYYKCDSANRRLEGNCYDCTASFDDWNKSDAATALCLKKSEKSSTKE